MILNKRAILFYSRAFGQMQSDKSHRANLYAFLARYYDKFIIKLQNLSPFLKFAPANPGTRSLLDF